MCEVKHQPTVVHHIQNDALQSYRFSLNNTRVAQELASQQETTLSYALSKVGDGSNTKSFLYFPANGINVNDLPDSCAIPKTATITLPPNPSNKLNFADNLVSVNRVDVALFKYRNMIYAINDKCPHMGGPLHLGDIEDVPDKGLCVQCPWHKWRFHLATGVAVYPQNRSFKAQVYPVKVDQNGDVFVGFKTCDQRYLVDEPF